MASCTVPSCGRTLRHDEQQYRKACGRCEHRIRGWLRELPRQLTLLEASLPRDRGPAQGSIHGGRAHAPLPVREDVITLLGPAAPGTVHDPHGDQTGPTPIPGVLHAWTEHVAAARATELPGTLRADELLNYLAAHLAWACTQPWIGDLHQELAELLSRIRSITRTEPRRHPKPAPCPGCEAFGLVEEDWQPYIECEVCGLLLTPAEYAAHAQRVMPALYRTAIWIATHERITAMNERVPVRVLLLVGDQAEIVADVQPAERAAPERYPAAEIAEAVGVPVSDLPGKRLTAVVGEDDRLSAWRLP